MHSMIQLTLAQNAHELVNKLNSINAFKELLIAIASYV